MEIFLQTGLDSWHQTESFQQIELYRHCEEPVGRISRRRNPPFVVGERRITLRGWARKYFQPDLQSVVERGADSCCVLADFDLEPRPAGPQAAGDDYDGIEQQNRPV